MALPEKLTYGSYEVLQNTDGSPCILGQGSFGVTYKARHGFLGRITALKVIREDLLNRGAKEDHEETNRFLDEARAVSKLNHPGIAMVHDCALDKGIFYYAMEYCDGGTLQDWCELWGAMPWSEVRSIAFQIASALEYAHATGFLHRDIKPANIMLNGQGKSRQAKLIDFGLAKKFGSDIESSSATVRSDRENFRGNFATASPEQILEKPLDRRSDLFSFGVTLWWLLIGRNPFGQMKRGPLIAERVGPLSYSSLLPEDLDPEARTLLEELLEKDSEKRISSAHEVVERLGFSATPVSVKPDIASPTPLEPLPEPADFEGGYSTPPHLFATAGQAKLYLSNNLVTGQPIIAVTNESLDPVVLGGMRIAASRKLDFGVYAFLDWRLSGGEDTFVISKPEGCSLLAVLRKFGPARFLDALPLLSHLARCFDASQAWTSFGIQVDPGEILVRARDGGANPDQFRSWSDVDPQGSRCLPLFTSDADQSASSEATLSTSAVEFPPLAQFAALVYRVLAGSAVRYAAFHTSSGYLMASGLSEDGNALLADTISAPEIQPSACRFLQLLASLESLPIAELTPLLEPPSLEELEIGKLVPIPSKPAISGDIHGPTLSDTTPNQLDNSTSVTGKVADLERQLSLAKRAVQEEAQRQGDEWAREEAEEEQRLKDEARIAEEETKRKEEEEVARQLAEDQRRADDLARQISEAERAAAFETRRREDEAQRRAEDNRIRREADIKKRALELDRLEAEANRAVEEARKSNEEAKRKAEDDRIRKETEAIERAQALDRQAATTKRAVEDARQKDKDVAEAKALRDADAKKHAAELARQADEATANSAKEAKLRDEEARRKAAEDKTKYDIEVKQHAAVLTSQTHKGTPRGDSKSTTSAASLSNSESEPVPRLISVTIPAVHVAKTPPKFEAPASLPLPVSPSRKLTVSRKHTAIAAVLVAAATTAALVLVPGGENGGKTISTRGTKSNVLVAAPAPSGTPPAVLPQTSRVDAVPTPDIPLAKSTPIQITITRSPNSGNGYHYADFKVVNIDGKDKDAPIREQQASKGFEAQLGSKWKVTLLGAKGDKDLESKPVASVTLAIPESGLSKAIAFQFPAVLPELIISNGYDYSDYSNVTISRSQDTTPSVASVTFSNSASTSRTITSSELTAERTLTGRRPDSFPENGRPPLRIPVAGRGQWSIAYTGSQLDDQSETFSTPFQEDAVAYTETTPPPYSGRYSFIAPMTKFPDDSLKNKSLKPSNDPPKEVEEGSPPEVDYFNEMVYVKDDTKLSEFRQTLKKAVPDLELQHHLCAVMDMDFRRNAPVSQMWMLLFYPHGEFAHYYGKLVVSGPAPGGGWRLRFDANSFFGGAIEGKNAHVDIKTWGEEKYAPAFKSIAVGPSHSKAIHKEIFDKCLESAFTDWITFYSSPPHSVNPLATSMASDLHFSTWQTQPKQALFFIDVERVGEVFCIRKVMEEIDNPNLCGGHAGKKDSPPAVRAVYFNPPRASKLRLLKREL